jgi:hypothetical protein
VWINDGNDNSTNQKLPDGFDSHKSVTLERQERVPQITQARRRSNEEQDAKGNADFGLESRNMKPIPILKSD